MQTLKIRCERSPVPRREPVGTLADRLTYPMRTHRALFRGQTIDLTSRINLRVEIIIPAVSRKPRIA